MCLSPLLDFSVYLLDAALDLNSLSYHLRTSEDLLLLSMLFFSL